jgi:hypothetical protein
MIGNVGTAVVMFPILRRYSETLSLSYVASRTIEATIIGLGAISLLFVVTLRDDLAASIGAARRPEQGTVRLPRCGGRVATSGCAWRMTMTEDVRREAATLTCCSPIV